MPKHMQGLSIRYGPNEWVRFYYGHELILTLTVGELILLGMEVEP